MRRFQALALLVSLASETAALAAEAPPFEALFAESLQWRSRDASFRPDGAWLSYFWQEEGAESLRALDTATGAESWRLPFAELVPEGETAAITPKSHLWSPRANALLLDDGDDLFFYDLAARKLRRLTRSPEREEHAAFSPDGQRIAFSRAADLWTIDLATGGESRWTTDGAPDEILNGTTDWVYWEEIWHRRARALWWSPDGSAIAFYRFDIRHLDRYPLLDERETYPKIRWQRYPKAGRRNPAVKVAVVDLVDGTIRPLETGDPEASYLARVDWRPDGRILAVQRLNREQSLLELLFCVPRTGSCSVVAAQTSPTWVNLADDFRFLADDGFLWGSEESGWRRLYRHDELGRRVKAATPEEYAIAKLDALLGEGSIAVTAFRPGGLGPARRQVLRIDLDTGAVTPLSAEGGWHGSEFDPTGRFRLHEWSDARTPLRRTLVSVDGQIVAPLPGAPEIPAELAALPPVELLEIPGPGGSRLPARLVRPAGFDSAKRYPVLMYHYGGPGSQVVQDAYDTRRGLWLWHRWLAARGYAVLAVDNEASTFFGKRGEDRLHRRFGPLELAAQKAAVDFLGTQAWADTSRLALWGWSGGGFHTLHALFHSPGTWRAGIAGAPVTDWRFYDSIWTERYLDHPEDNPAGYRDSSPIHFADRLADTLLLVHGTGDDNVHPQNTLALLDQLIAAGKPVETALYPREKHTFTDPAWRHFLARMTDFLDRQLAPQLALQER